MLPASGAARRGPRNARGRTGAPDAITLGAPAGSVAGAGAVAGRIVLIVTVALVTAAGSGALAGGATVTSEVRAGRPASAEGVDVPRVHAGLHPAGPRPDRSASDAGTAPDPSTGRLDGLVRWRATGFTPVGPGSVEGGRVHVLVPADASASEWTAIRDLARAVAATDRDAIVLAYSWPASPGGLRAGRGARERAAPTALSDRSGQSLARAWTLAAHPRWADHGGMLHLVGDGPGARVVVVAALQMVPAPDQLTLLDSPERARPAGTANRLAGYLPGLVVGRTRGTTRVDNYDSGPGADYGATPGLGAVVDVRLTAATRSGADRGPSPRGALDWYTASVRSPGAGVGWAWSPLAGGSFEDLAPAYRTVRTRTPPRTPPARPDAPVLTLAERRRSPTRAVTAGPVAVFDPAGARAGNPEATAAVVTDARTWEADLTTGREDLGLGLDYRFLRGAGGSRLRVRLDGALRAVVDGAYAGRSGQRLVIDVAGLTAGRHRLSIDLDPVGPSARRPAARDPRGPAVAVANLRMLRPEPGAGVRPGGRAATVGAVVAAAFVIAAGLAGVAASERRRAQAGCDPPT